jgi:hypothetical protein
MGGTCSACEGDKRGFWLYGLREEVTRRQRLRRGNDSEINMAMKLP